MTMAGGTRAKITRELAESLYRVCECRGEHVRLDWRSRNGLPAGLSPASAMQFPQEEIHDVLRALPWRVVRQRHIGRPAHVHVQELRAVRMELKDLALSTAPPLRHINVVDSRVALGASAKGRSSSWRLNGVLRSAMPYALAGRKQMSGLWAASAENPSDDPTRFVEIRAPMAP